MSTLIKLSVGSEIWFDAEIWKVAELGSKTIQLMRGSDLRTVSTELVLNRAKIIDDGPAESFAPDDEPANLALTNLTAQQLAKLDDRANLVRELLVGTNSGDLSNRQHLAAKQAGVSKRTIQRWVAAYRELGVAGLADSSLTGQYSPAVDPRWDDACIQVLDSFVSRSTPSKSAIIDLINKRIRESYGSNEVRAPSRATAYRRLEALAKGRYAFGNAKQRRSVANRPGTPYGRLRATRPGEYVVLDTTPLDVFAIEAVSCRWVPVELTVAQDLNYSFDAIFDFFTDQNFGLFIKYLANGGRCVTCGFKNQHSVMHRESDANTSFSSVLAELIVGNKLLIGNFIGTKIDLVEAVDHYADVAVPIDSAFELGLSEKFINRTFNEPEKFGKVIFRYT